MAGHLNVARKQALLSSAIALSVLSAGVAHAQVPAAPAAAAAGDPRTLILTPSIGIQGAYTDNVRLTEDKEADFLTRAFLGLDGTVNGARANAVLQVQAAYDFYADADDLNGWSFNGFGAGSYDLVQNVLSLEADAGVTSGTVSTFGGSAIDRAGTDGRVQLSTVGFGPRLTTKLALFDLNASARISAVNYEEADSSTVSTLPDDSTLFNAAVELDTAERLSNLQLGLLGSYEEDDQTYRRYTAVASSFFRVAPSLRLIARAGYDDIEDTSSLVDIGDPLWSVGVEYNPSERVLVSLEGGQRFDEPAWAALANIQVSNQFYLNGSYTETVEPDQGRLDRDFQDFVAQQGAAATPLTQDQFTFSGALLDGTSRNKLADVSAVYAAPLYQAEASVYWSDRYFYDTRTNQREVGVRGSYTRQLRPDLRAQLSGDYAETYESAVFGDSRSWRLLGALTYNLNPTLELTGGYAYSDNEADLTGEDIQENIVFVSLMKTF